MQSALLFLALVALSQAGVPMPRDLSGRIINGEDVKLGEIPFQVSLQLRGSNFHFCGGSVLNKAYVITAAHCVVSKTASTIKIVAGSVSLDDPKAVHFAANIIIHEQYSPANSWMNDIALIEIDEPFVVSKSLSFVPLPKPGQTVPVGAVAVVSGWGRLWWDGPTPKILQRAEIQIAAQDYCHQVWGNNGFLIYDTQICAYDPKVITGGCKGDSGGPLTVNGKLVGLVSWSRNCADVEYPSVYTRVSEYIDWINEHAI